MQLKSLKQATACPCIGIGNPKQHLAVLCSERNRCDVQNLQHGVRRHIRRRRNRSTENVFSLLRQTGMAKHGKTEKRSVCICEKIRTNHTIKLALNGLNLNLRVGLSVAHLALFALLRLVSEDRNLLSLAVLQDLA